jgi:hypothetical protein
VASTSPPPKPPAAQGIKVADSLRRITRRRFQLNLYKKIVVVEISGRLDAGHAFRPQIIPLGKAVFDAAIVPERALQRLITAALRASIRANVGRTTFDVDVGLEEKQQYLNCEPEQDAPPSHADQRPNADHSGVG